VAAYDVPTDAVAHPVDIDPRRAADLTWVAQCPETTGSDAPATGPDIGTATVTDATGPLRCLGDNGWLWALTPPDRVPTGGGVEVTTLALSPLQGIESRIVAAYEPVPFEDFPFDQAEPMVSFPAPDVGTAPAEEGQLDLEHRESARITMDDLDADGRATFEVPESDMTELCVLTEGVGRFRLESVAPVDGAITTASQGGSLVGKGLERDGWWTSWTDQGATWPITPETERGVLADQVTVQAEGYEQGSFELRVFGQFPEGEQP
jgi:hypothetical protein